MLLGIDIGTSSIKGMLMEEDGKDCFSEVRAVIRWRFPGPAGRSRILRCGGKGCVMLLAQMRQERPDILDGVRGIGFPGRCTG